MNSQTARPICMVILTATLGFLAIGEACGYPAPLWFVSPAIIIVSGLMIERAVRKSKGED